MMSVVGVDGCRAGWIGVSWGAQVVHQLFGNITEIIATDALVIAIDMAIALAENGSRGAEVEGRKVLGARKSSLFSMPTRAALVATDYREACTINTQHTNPPRQISKQCFHLFSKMREIEAVMAPALQSRLYEAHPELAFWAMNDCSPLAHPKKMKGRPFEPGLSQRRALLHKAGFPLDQLPPANYRKSDVGEDDLLDACACAVAARRIAEGRAIHFPDMEERNARGLIMRISC